MAKLQSNPIRVKGLDETRRYAKIVADAYEAAPWDRTCIDRAALASYMALIGDVERIYRQVASRVKIVFVDGQPYRNETALNKDVTENKRLQISTQFNEHPLFTPEQNLKFRVVHDWYAHVAGGAPFTQRGELRAYNAQAKMTSRKALPALFTEVLAQAAYATVYGEFGEQKVVILPGFDYYNVGRGPAVDAAKEQEWYQKPTTPWVDPTAQYYEADGVTLKGQKQNPTQHWKDLGGKDTYRVNALPPRSSNWYAMAKQLDLGVVDLDWVAADLGYYNFHDLDVAISPRSVINGAKRQDLLTSLRDVTEAGTTDEEMMKAANLPYKYRNFLFIFGTQRESFATEAEALDWADNSASVPKLASFTILDQIRNYPKHYLKS